MYCPPRSIPSPAKQASTADTIAIVAQGWVVGARLNLGGTPLSGANTRRLIDLDNARTLLS
jgi:hypothetical protein